MKRTITWTLLLLTVLLAADVRGAGTCADGGKRCLTQPGTGRCGTGCIGMCVGGDAQTGCYYQRCLNAAPVCVSLPFGRQGCASDGDCDAGQVCVSDNGSVGCGTGFSQCMHVCFEATTTSTTSTTTTSTTTTTTTTTGVTTTSTTTTSTTTTSTTSTSTTSTTTTSTTTTSTTTTSTTTTTTTTTVTTTTIVEEGILGATYGVASGGLTLNSSSPRIGFDTQTYSGSQDAGILIPNAITATALTVRIVNTLTGTQTATFTFRINNSDTALAVTFNSGSPNVLSSTGSVAVADGDKVYVNLTFGGGGTVTFLGSIFLDYTLP